MPIVLKPSPNQWLECVLENFDDFLLDHASAEKKASGMALTFVSHYPDRARLVKIMTDVAIEELSHFKEVLKLIQERNLQLAGDKKDPYINQLFKLSQKGSENYFIDRLLIAGIVEARGYERFALVAEGLPSGNLKTFYESIAKSESRHAEIFLDLANYYSETIDADSRCQELIIAEGDIMSALTITPSLH